jgi:uncharacterized protein with PIN domain
LIVTTYLLRCVELGREQQARHGKLRRDLAGVIRTRWPDVSIELAPGRLLVHGTVDLAELVALPGVLSVSPCLQVARDEVIAAAVAIARDAGTFSVRVRRDRRHGGPRSLDIARAIAEAITAATGARVDFDHPDVAIGVELRGETALVFDRVIPGIDRTGPAAPRIPGEPRFVADQMLGRLAARLRLLGYDTLTVHDLADSEVTRLAAGRILLTRDAALARTQAVPAHFVVATSPREQLAEVVAALALTPDPSRLFTRCTLCNTPVEPAAEADVDIPPGVRDQGLAFFRCPGCGQVYWRGSHVDRILDDLAASGVHSRKSTDASR